MKYIGIKFVDAVPMTSEAAEKKGYRVSNNKGDGYEVTYDDGYKSWCPKDVFEAHNFVIKNELLAIMKYIQSQIKDGEEEKAYHTQH